MGRRPGPRVDRRHRAAQEHAEVGRPAARYHHITVHDRSRGFWSDRIGGSMESL